MPNAEMVYVHAYLNIKVIPILVVVQNAFLAQTVRKREHVLEISVPIRVQAHADKTHNAML